MRFDDDVDFPELASSGIRQKLGLGDCSITGELLVKKGHYLLECVASFRHKTSNEDWAT
ncbi:MAG: hypothetical protein KKE97_08090 [Proteobacteria bacterium]|nr:hypothetical protein [Pseudomonadota bacterium]MBU4584074.1 hypothetical protein [Pseudomonadota bacterium]